MARRVRSRSFSSRPWRALARGAAAARSFRSRRAYRVRLEAPRRLPRPRLSRGRALWGPAWQERTIASRVRLGRAYYDKARAGGERARGLARAEAGPADPRRGRADASATPTTSSANTSAEATRFAEALAIREAAEPSRATLGTRSDLGYLYLATGDPRPRSRCSNPSWPRTPGAPRRRQGLGARTFRPRRFGQGARGRGGALVAEHRAAPGAAPSTARWWAGGDRSRPSPRRMRAPSCASRRAAARSACARHQRQPEPAGSTGRRRPPWAMWGPRPAHHRCGALAARSRDGETIPRCAHAHDRGARPLAQGDSAGAAALSHERLPGQAQPGRRPARHRRRARPASLLRGPSRARRAARRQHHDPDRAAGPRGRSTGRHVAHTDAS